jgi:SOUL heme-binding protein
VIPDLSFLLGALILGLAAIPILVAQETRPSVADADRVVAYVPARLPDSGETLSVGRKPVLETAKAGEDFWVCGDGRITTPLPVGYPAPTAPGAIELKAYPSVRRAEVSGAAPPDLASNVGFWKLFRHIKSRDIPMTSPVEMDYRGIDLAGSRDDQSWSMAFLYREPSLGATGKSGDVNVVDSVPTVVLSVGALGSYGLPDAMRVLATLRRALAEIDRLEPVGSVRVLHYNGPDVPDGSRWFEVQVPVRLKAPK